MAIIKKNSPLYNLSGGAPNARQSNLELYRIIVMLLIVAHHYVVNSRLMALDGPIYSDMCSWRSLFLLLFGAWGKIGINCFVMITGYFMCKSKITLKKFLKLLLEINFYKITIYLVFLMTGYEAFSIKQLLIAIFPINSVHQNFTGCYLIFFLCIPFLNILVNSMNEKQHIALLSLLLTIYVIVASIPKFNVIFNYVTWFCIIYLIASYIRVYPKALFFKTKIWGVLTLVFVFLSIASVVVCWLVPSMIGLNPIPYFFVNDSNKILAVCVGVSSFIFFKNLKIKNSTFINAVASTTFGVLQIHANSDTMRQWLWQDTLNNVGMYYSNYMIVHAIGSVVCIFIVCSVIDYLRIKILERPLFNIWDKWGEKIELKFFSFSNHILNKITDYKKSN